MKNAVAVMDDDLTWQGTARLLRLWKVSGKICVKLVKLTPKHD